MSAFGVVPATASDRGPMTPSSRAAGCSTSHALFPIPISTRYAEPRWYDHRAVLQANHGDLWAGYAYDGSRQNLYAAITWKRGENHATVLGRFTHPTGNFAGVVSLAGITAKHVVVASIKHTHSDSHYGMSWYRGSAHRLAQRSSWVSVAPFGVADRGAIFGVVRSIYHGRSHYLIVRWAHRLAAAVVVRELGSHSTDATADARGDIVYAPYGGPLRARLADSGRTVTLADHNGAVTGISTPTVAGGASFFAATEDGIERWDLNSTLSGTVRASTPVVRHKAGRYYLPVAAGRGGALVFDGDRPWLRAAGGKVFALSASAVGRPAVNAAGSLARTSRSDGRVHLVSCR